MSTTHNFVSLIGNLGKDPIITRLENNNEVARFSLATDDFILDNTGKKVKTTTWHSIIAWGQTARYVSDAAKKGSRLALKGKLITRRFLTSQGDVKHITTVEAVNVVAIY